MKSFLQYIQEAIPLSLSKQYMKYWDRGALDYIFGKGTNRIYIPLKGQGIDSTKEEIERIINASDKFSFDDDLYNKNMVKVKNSVNFTKITTALASILRDNKQKLDSLLKSYNDFRSRGSHKINDSNLLAVISRHPHDIAGMSTDRSWDDSSCMSLGINRHGVITRQEGCNAKLLPLEIERNSIVSYLITSNDKNIQHPIGRIILKQYITSADNPVSRKWVMSPEMYGTVTPEFIDVVQKWTNGANSKSIQGVTHYLNTGYIPRDMPQSLGHTHDIGSIADGDNAETILQQLYQGNNSNLSELIHLCKTSTNYAKFFDDLAKQTNWFDGVTLYYEPHPIYKIDWTLRFENDLSISRLNGKGIPILLYIDSGGNGFFNCSNIFVKTQFYTHFRNCDDITFVECRDTKDVIEIGGSKNEYYKCDLSCDAGDFDNIGSRINDVRKNIYIDCSMRIHFIAKQNSDSNNEEILYSFSMSYDKFDAKNLLKNVKEAHDRAMKEKIEFRHASYYGKQTEDDSRIEFKIGNSAVSVSKYKAITKIHRLRRFINAVDSDEE